MIVALTLLALGAGAAVFLVPRLTGPGAGAQVATGEPATPVTGITTAPVTVNVGSPETMEAEAKAEPGETATEAEPADAPEVAPDENSQGDTAVAAGGEQEPEVTEGEDDDPRDRRRRRRDRQRDSSSSGRRDVAGDKDSSKRPGEPSQGSVTPGTGDASGPAEDDEPRPRPTPTPAPEVGRVDPEATRRVVRAHLGEIRTCHERGRMDDPDLAGRVVVRIGIGRGGKVTSAAIASSTLATPSVEKCITSAVQKWTFPAPSGASTAVIEYPFVLR